MLASSLTALAVATSLSFAPAEAAGPQASTNQAFVRVDGNRFVIDGRPFHFVGANLSIMHHPEKRRGAEEVLTAAARDGIRVARIWAFGDGPQRATLWQRAYLFFRAGPTGWIEGAPAHLDRVIATAGRLGIRLIICLSNHWADYGGVPQYLEWAGLGRADRFGAADRYYQDPRTRAAFRAHVERLLSRTNQVTGVRYRDDPTVLAWELMNESKVDTPAGALARRAWIGEMGQLVKRLAPNQLVSAGVSLYRLLRERREWEAVCRLPEVDFCDGHIYPEETLAERPPELLDRAIDDFVLIAQHRVGKPFVLGEFGVHGDAAGIWQGQPRTEWIRRIYARLTYDGAAGGLLWIYQPSRTPTGGHAVVMGDPASEEIRAVVRRAAAALADPRPPTNPLLTRDADRGEEALLPLHAEVAGRTAVIPFLRFDATSKVATGSSRPAIKSQVGGNVRWDPADFDRAYWESSGVYGGGVLEHAWGGETGWFEYAFVVPAAEDDLVPERIVLRARMSSEYPGTLSPRNGTSPVSVTFDGLPVGAVLAARDDGMGRWVTLTSSDPAVLRAATSPGRHRLRFTVPDDPKAHGLCLYGRAGKKARPDTDIGFIELVVNGKRHDVRAQRD